MTWIRAAASRFSGRPAMAANGRSPCNSLVDSADACKLQLGGRPAWGAVVVPSSINSQPAKGFSTLGHTYWGIANAKNAACQQVYASNIMMAVEARLADPARTTTDVVNMVLHPVIDYDHNPDVRAIYDTFIDDLGARPDVIGMTVRQFMCQRVAVCYDD